MSVFYKKSPLEREWELVEKKEEKDLERRRVQKDSLLNRKLEEKIPQTLQERLDTAFAKAFTLILDKGTGIIEKTYKKAEMEKDHQVNAFAASLKDDRKTLRAFSRKAGSSGNKNLLLSGVEGLGLGLLGIGLPDIPLFVGMIFKSVYEISLHFGYAYQEEREKYFILLLIRGALTHGTLLEETEAEVQRYIREETLPGGYDRQREIRKTAEALSGELLYMKFLQGIPVAGAVGGAYDTVYLRRILGYSRTKYQKRFLLKQKKIAEKVK